MKPKVYVETSIVSYLTALRSRDLLVVAHQEVTQEWWDLRSGDYDLFASELVVEEARAGDSEAAGRRLEILAPLSLLVANDLAIEVARAVLDAAHLPETAADDALHIGIAAATGMDFLLTWNCAHIANAAIRGRIEKVCRSYGLVPPVICTPLELLE
jgi:hypothetical protein